MPRLVACCLLLALCSAAAADEPTRAGLDFFETKIRPVLVASCYECHSAEAAQKNNLKGKLLLDTRAGTLRGGESGPAVVPGKPDESLLIGALRHESFEMPPKSKLPDDVIAGFVKWIEMGAPDPREGAVSVKATQIDLEAGRQHWAFQPLRPVSPPTVADQQWPRTPIDRFIRARQQAAGIVPNGRADARTLIRRVSFDLIGLPPTPEETEQFLAEAA